MAFNPFIIKKWGALLLVGFLSTLSYMIGQAMYRNFTYALGFFGVGLILGVFLANLMLKNPFTLMLEGKGILCLNLDSTGIIKPFIVGVQSPYIYGKLGNEEVKDVFDRETIFSLAVPEKKGTASPIEEGELKGGINISVNEEEYNKARFALFHYPCIIYNAQIKSLLTKDTLSELEKDTFAEHSVIYLNRKMEELSSSLRDFARYVVETLKPKSSIFASKWFIWIVIVLIIILVALFAPAVIKQMSGFAGEMGFSLGKAQAAVTPR